jgi:hypothetical protein
MAKTKIEDLRKKSPEKSPVKSRSKKLPKKPLGEPVDVKGLAGGVDPPVCHAEASRLGKI